MSSPQFRRIAFLAVAVFMVASGLVLAGQSLLQLSLGSGLPVWQKPEIFGIGGGQSAALLETSRVLSASTDTTFTDTASTDEASSYRLRAQDALTTTPIAAATSHPLVAIPLTISYASDVPVDLLRAINTLALREGNVVTATEREVTETLHFDWDALAGSAFFTQTFVAATRFDTIDPAIDWGSLQRMWQGEPLTFTTIAILTNTLSAPQQSLGESAWDDRTTLVLLPFDQLVPRLATLAIDGQNPLENASHFDPARYPFYATVYLHHASATDVSATDASITDASASWVCKWMNLARFGPLPSSATSLHRLISPSLATRSPSRLTAKPMITPTRCSFAANPPIGRRCKVLALI